MQKYCYFAISGTPEECICWASGGGATGASVPLSNVDDSGRRGEDNGRFVVLISPDTVLDRMGAAFARKVGVLIRSDVVLTRSDLGVKLSRLTDGSTLARETRVGETAMADGSCKS